MKKLLAVIGVILLVATLAPAAALAAEEEGVTCTVTAQLVSVSISDGNVAYGILPLSPSAGSPSTKSTLSGELDDTQTATNNGNVTEDFDIKSSGATGGTGWTLVAAGSIATDAFAHQFSTDSGSTWTDLTGTYATLATGIDTSQTFDLKILMPTGTTDNVEKTITVTVRATAS